MARGLDEKENVLTSMSGWTACEVAEIYVERLEGFKGRDERSGFVLNAQH